MTTTLPTEMAATQSAQYSLPSSASTPTFLQVHAMCALNTVSTVLQTPAALSASPLQSVFQMRLDSFAQPIAPLFPTAQYAQYQIQRLLAIVV